jgi:exodeoxyribonuclease-3
MGLLDKLNQEHNPDIICLQETKVADVSFPHSACKKLGFHHIAISGEKSYNGVAILSKMPLSDIEIIKFGGNEDKRHIAVTLPCGTKLHNFYVPAGGDTPDPNENIKFAHKLRFMDEMFDYFSTKSHDDKIVIVGDMNIAPLEHDVWSHKQLLSVVSHTPVEVEKMESLRNTMNWIDTHRHFVPSDEKLYSWWSYRNKDWKKSNRGRRLDHIWITPELKSRLKSIEIVKLARDWERPSDHVPILTEFH